MHGTLFLDEIGEISPKFQASFLRAIQERQIIRVGGKELIDIDVRFITVTNQDLRQKVKDGTFRSDLFFRLNVLPLTVPPLRRRKADIPALLKYFLREDYRNVTQAELAFLDQYSWPGNVRELENVCTFYKTMHRFPEYLFADIPEEAPRRGPDDGSREILKLIQENTCPAHGIGRANLIYQLKSRNCLLSDRSLRQILEDLRRKGLITVKPGRCGAQITEQGSAYLRTFSPDSKSTENSW